MDDPDLGFPLLKSPQSCRICRGHETSRNDMLISACKCIGSVGKIHTQCLKAWILSRQLPMHEAMACELCKTAYRLVQRRRLAWDRRHAFSCRAMTYATAFVLLVACTVGVTWTVGALLPTVGSSNLVNMLPLIMLLVTSMLVAITSLWQLFSRWRTKACILYFDAAVENC
ncbi:hypothetical protein H257_17784 [Aphanomyces astaci]|uniref:RING-CH-type domain-containing protein n=1 Tax=Aphanomyces astaci TaxID=112090 RepID=W4FF60_APHAT|nr:hypothetical protein H257_17784 [Aphanomyces astaci]ETV65524.1 hypothetical protein H257_17784 [Aphanomyces astaci]|eukprot:XP_009845012.1 hypothetical protein H257_17784 [Aphanomyces astaci]